MSEYPFNYLSIWLTPYRVVLFLTRSCSKIIKPEMKPYWYPDNYPDNSVSGKWISGW